MLVVALDDQAGQLRVVAQRGQVDIVFGRLAQVQVFEAAQIIELQDVGLRQLVHAQAQALQVAQLAQGFQMDGLPVAIDGQAGHMRQRAQDAGIEHPRVVTVDADGQRRAAGGGQGVEVGQQRLRLAQGIELHQYLLAARDGGADRPGVDAPGVLDA
ncbi:hypothetical protein D3C81_1355450 [compost metagenome]